MTPASLTILLGLVSAVTVALANLTVKRGGDVLAARVVLSATMAACVAPFAFLVPLPPARLWDDMGVAIAVHWAYQFALVRALHRGDLSLVFPMARGLAPLFAAILAWFVLQERLAGLALAGLLVASAALIVFALPAGTGTQRRRPSATVLFWAGLTAAGVAAYAVVDARVVRLMPQAGSFIVWLFLLDWVGVAAVMVWVRRGHVLSALRRQAPAVVPGGVAGVISYAAALYAYDLSPSAALVTALRETSVVFAALFGAVFLREGFGARRLAAAGVLAAGLGLMQFAAPA